MKLKSKNIIIGVGVVALLGFIIKTKVARANPPQIFYVKRMAGNYNARTIPPFGIFISEKEKGNTALLEHELIHWNQFKKLGLVRYYQEYVKQLNEYGYDKMPMELEARQNESEWVKQNYTMAVRNGYAKTALNPNFRK